MPRTKKDRTLDPKVERTIIALRVAGMPERNTYEALRRNLKNAPSYRDVRAAYDRAGLKTRHDATLRRHTDQPVLTASNPEKNLVRTHYRAKVEELRSAPYYDEASRKFGREQLDDRFIVGYGARAGLTADDIQDESEVFEVFDSVEQGEGS